MSKKEFEDHYWKHHVQGLEERHKMALELIGDARSVLDLGCGDGFFLRHVRAQRKIGLELSENAVKHASENGIDVRLFDFEHEELPFEDDEFDVVTLLDVLEHTFEPHVYLRRAARVGKKVIVTVPNFAFACSRFQTLIGKVPTILNERKGHTFYFTKEKLQEIFKRAGVKIIKVEYYFPLMRMRGIGLVSRLPGLLFKGFFATEFAVVGEREKFPE